MKGRNNPRKSNFFFGTDDAILATFLALVILGLLCPSYVYAGQGYFGSSDAAVPGILCHDEGAGQLYSNRSQFLSALEDEIVIDFEDQPIGNVAGDPWFSYGIAFDESGPGDNMAIGGGGGANKNIYALGGESADIDIAFPAALSAFGLDVFSNHKHGRNERIVFYDRYGSILANVEMPLTAFRGTAFVGYVCDAPIISGVDFIEGNCDGDYAGIGDVALVIPEPGTMLLLGLGVMGLIRRKR
jgi:hypothetical protein